MRLVKYFLLTLILSAASAQSFAAYAPDFDRGVDIELAIQAAIESATSAGGLLPAAREAAVWVSMEKSDAGTMDAALFKRAPLAANQKIAIYEVDPADL
ncbi:MAG TPA: hypothetical protein DCZ92_12830, partial [Elusimicrobia bacterium]|nr:hypothetical protein [Elusimicrobiota bacterium]